MAGKLSLIRSDDFTGGLNLRADQFQLGENESPDLLNVDIDPRGGFTVRGAWRRTSTNAIDGISNGSFTPRRIFNWAGSSPQLLIAANGEVHYSTGGASWTDTTINYSASDGASFAAWANSSTKFVYCALGRAEAQMAKWSGSAATNLTASATAAWQDSYGSPTGTHMPKADFCAVHADRLWVAATRENGTDYLNRVRYSHVNFPESWREVDYIDIPGGGDGITALVPWRDVLLVFKRSAIYGIYGYDSDSFQVVPLTFTLGSLSSLSVVATERGVYFFHWPEGMFRFDGNGFEDVFSRLRPMIQDGDINAGELDQVWVSHCNNRVWLSVPTGAASTPTYTYVFDDTTSAWTKYQGYDGKGLACLTDFVVSTGARLYIALHPTQPYALEVDDSTIATDDLIGVEGEYESYYVTRWQDGNLVSAKKMWRSPDFVVKQADAEYELTVEVFKDWREEAPARIFTITVDSASSTALVYTADAAEPDGVDGYDEGVYGGAAEGAQYERGQRLGLARSVQLKISGPGAVVWGVNSITYKYTARRIR